MFSFHDGWLGGINYFRNLFTALYALPERKIEAVIFTGLRSPAKHFERFPAVTIVRSRIFDRGSFPWLIRKLWSHFVSHDLLLERLLKKYGVEVLSHSGWLDKSSSIPTIGWIPDFQHVHLPSLFNVKEIQMRKNEFHNVCHFCSTVIVSSYDAQSDLHRFAPDCRRKSEVLQFVAASAEPETMLPSRKEVEMRYKFSGNYFLLPNQFWRHKNHSVVIEALGLLIREGKRVFVLATGNNEDYRHPQYFSSLIGRAKELNVLDNFCPLGVVPAHDLAALMRYSSAIINPSLFEGWSTTVEEAKALGKHVVLSDIPVHREQNPALATFFSPEDANALAAILWEVWNKPCSDELQRIEHARRVTDKRRLEFARKYQRIVQKVVENC